MSLQTPIWRARPTLAGRDYATDAVCAEERERIWFGGWICIGRATLG